MDNSGAGKSPNTSLSFRYNANNEELEELCGICDDDPPTPQCDVSKSESASPKRIEKTSSILDKYFKSIRAIEKIEDLKAGEPKPTEESRSPPKDVTSSPMKEYLKSFGKRNNSEGTPEPKEGGNETWRIFHDFKYKITQAVEDMKTRSSEDAKDKVVRDNSVSDSEENSAVKDSDISVGDTDNQVSSLNSSLHNLSELTQPLTAKPNEGSPVKDNSEGSDDTHKNLIHSGPADVTKFDFNTEVESGVEAFEDVFNNMEETNKDNINTPKLSFEVPESPPKAPDITLPPLLKESLLEKPRNVTNTNDIHFVSYTMCLLTLFLCVNYCLLPTWSSWNSFIFGLWAFCIASNSKRWVTETFFSESEPQTRTLPRKESASLPMYTIPSVKEHRPIKKFEGWINHYRSHNYDPFTYNINKTTTAFIKLDGPCLRLSYTSTKIPKRALWDEKLDPVLFYQHRLYSLVGARIMLLPKGLVRRRQWSKKYPICITLSEDEKIQVLEKETIGGSVASDKKKPETPEPRRESPSPGMESAETNTSPEKRKKFVWRRRDKSVTHAEIEGSKEGLRHRLGRKKNRDKKTDVAISTEGNGGADKPAEETPSEPEVAQGSALAFDILDLDDTDANVKEFLEETEVEQMADNAMEGEWSLHVKQSRGRHSHLYLFARTGREKHEWYRRFLLSISEANHVSPAEPDEALEGSSGAAYPAAGSTGSDRESIEMAVFHAHEDKEGVSLYSGTANLGSSPQLPPSASSPPRAPDSPQSGAEEPAPLHGLYRDYLTHEKYFWPYFLKIIESHETAYKLTSEACVMCDLEPSPAARSKSKRKKKDAGRLGVSCECRMLPAEVSWLNTALARVFYDVMRDAALAQRMQARIQRKLHTLKLPAFMSPLVVTQLSLLGACPLVARVASPAWDERGLWLDADLRYAGGAYITILTQINLMKLKEKNITLEEQLLDAEDSAESLRGRGHTGLPFERFLRKSKPAVFDSDMEDSAESSDDDETPPLQPVDSAETVRGRDSPPPEPAAVPGSSKKKFLRMVDKIATNKYFQQVTDYKYVKRAMEGLSNTDIKLQLEVQGLDGRLAINIPPPPHDRIWVGFRTNPQLVLKARPTVGARTLRFAHISNWIEQKLTKEFEKVLVIPNMEDIVIDCLSPTPIDFE